MVENVKKVINAFYLLDELENALTILKELRLQKYQNKLK